MKTSKLAARALVALGFGGAVGLSGGCSASRAQRSRVVGEVPAAGSVVVRDGDAPVRVMYGSPPARFDPDRQVPRMEADTTQLEEVIVIGMYGVPNARYDLYRSVPGKAAPRR